MKKSEMTKIEVRKMILKGMLMALLCVMLSLPASAHDTQQGTVGQHEQPSVTCYSNRTGTGKIVIQPNAAGLAGGPYAVKYDIYTWRDNQWSLVYTSPFYIYQPGVTYDPLVIPATTGYFAVVAEYWWHDGRAWSGSDRTTATTYRQEADYSLDPTGSPPPARSPSETCYAG